jgi:hypothetical protein
MLGHGATGQFAIGQAAATAGEIITVDKWYQALSQPARSLPRSPAATAQFSIAPPFPPVVPFSWFAPLSEPPVKTLQGLRPSQQQFAAFNPLPRVSFSWFAPLSEPPRKLPPLDAAKHQFLAAPSRLLPTPTTFGTLAAIETKDTFLGGARAWNRIVSGEIGIVAPAAPTAQIAVVTPPSTTAPSTAAIGGFWATATNIIKQ